MAAPFIVGIGGTLRAQSSSARALNYCLDRAKSRGARVSLYTGEDLKAPLYEPGMALDGTNMAPVIEALRTADGVILASPGYHGSISGALKNVLDYTEEMAKDARPYFDGRAVGCVVSAAGWQGGASTLAALRAIVHALRGWPTPLGVVLNSAEPLFDADGRFLSTDIARNLDVMTDQVIEFAQNQSARCKRAAMSAKV